MADKENGSRGGRRSRRKRSCQGEGSPSYATFTILTFEVRNGVRSDCKVQVNEVLAKATSEFSYRLRKLKLIAQSPASVTHGDTVVHTGHQTGQLSGFMRQDGLLQQIPMTTWMQMNNMRTTRFDGQDLESSIYAGGYLPITAVDEAPFILFSTIWLPSEIVDTVSFNMTVELHCVFDLDQVLVPDIVPIKATYVEIVKQDSGSDGDDDLPELIPLDTSLVPLAIEEEPS
jgi:hypothetical protein